MVAVSITGNLINSSMRIDELMFPSTIDKAGLLLTKAGYKPLGQGSYGDVFRKKNSSYVLKVFLNRDKAYIAFVNAIKNISNKYFPKIIGKLVKVTDEYSAVRLEPLVDVKNETKSELYCRDIDDYIRNTIKSKKIRLDNIVVKNQELRDACDVIIEVLRSNSSFYLDIKSNNIMQRGRDIVIIDPLFNI